MLHDGAVFCLKNGNEAATRDEKCIYLVLLMRSVALAVNLVFVISASICDVHSKHGTQANLLADLVRCNIDILVDLVPCNVDIRTDFVPGNVDIIWTGLVPCNIDIRE